MIKRILAVSAIGAVGMLGMNAIPAGASSHIGPNVNLKMKNGVLKFVPSTLNVPVKPGKKCKVTSYQFSITNKSGSTQTVLQQGNTGDVLPGREDRLLQRRAVPVGIHRSRNLGRAHCQRELKTPSKREPLVALPLEWSSGRPFQVAPEGPSRVMRLGSPWAARSEGG